MGPTISRFLIATLLPVALSAGCVKKSTHQKTLDELETAQSELEATRAQAAERAERIAALEKELETARGSLQSAKKQGAATEDELEQLAANMQATKAELTELRKQRDAAQERMAAFRRLKKKLKSLVDTGKLEVEFRNGQMVLKLPSAVLFASARARLSKGGQSSLQEILDILLEFKGRRFMIAGHTDNVKIRGGRFEDNWDLSTSRAVSVVNYMVGAGFDAENLVAAGFGANAPVATNETKEGRAQNRRIEIILLPDLSELPNLTTEDGAKAGS